MCAFFTKKRKNKTRKHSTVKYHRMVLGHQSSYQTPTPRGGQSLVLSGGGADKKWCIVQYDDREITDDLKGLMNRNKHYCNKYGYTYIFKSSGYDDLPPYWRKVKIVKDLIDSDLYKGVLWMDTDATVFNMSITLDSFNDSMKSFYSSTNSRGNQIFNAGVWIVYNNERGRKILDTWIKKYNSSKWKRNGTKWHSNSAWAGRNYEQGSFAYNVMPEFQSNVKTEPESTFQATNVLQPNAFILHFYNDNRPKVPAFLKEHSLPMILEI
jgi:hypothetical protein